MASKASLWPGTWKLEADDARGRKGCEVPATSWDTWPVRAALGREEELPAPATPQAPSPLQVEVFADGLCRRHSHPHSVS